MDSLQHTFINMVRAAITNSKPPDCDNWVEILKIAERHGMVNVLTELSAQYPDMPENVRSALTETQEMQLVKDANQEFEVNGIIGELEENGIKAIMLKGWYLKQLYPRRDLRVMVDTDIFIRQSDEMAVHKILTEREFQCKCLGNKKDNEYTKFPFIALEIHKNLFVYEEVFNENFNSPESDMYIWNRLVPIEGYSNIYRMDDELFFVYLIAHIVKHLTSGSGIGVRAFLDLWVYIKNKPNLDFDIINRDFESVGIGKFADNAVALAMYWFDNKPVPPEVEELGDHIFNCGVYGTSDFFVANNEVLRDGKKHGKWGYAFRRAFPGMDSMKIRYPQLKKKPWLLPVCYSKRLMYSLTHRKDWIKGELDSVEKIDYKKVQQIRELYKKVGLEDNKR